MDCRILFVLVCCIFASTYAACIASQPENSVKQNGLIFDPYYYMNARGFPNVETSLYHWYYNGYYAGLQGNSFFNVNEYKQIYPELASYDNPAAHRHFVECGYYENRVGLWSLYCGSNNGGCHSSTTCTNANAQRTCGPCPAGHVGDGSGSCPVDLSSSNVLLNANVYSYDYYVSANTDLAGLTTDGAAQHWIFNGVDEGRQAISSFNVNDYKRIYADAAGLSNRDAVAHFISNSGRVGIWAWFCGNNNGGCDSHVTCNNYGSAAPSCGMCPFPAMEGNGKVAGGCYPSYVFNYKVWSYTDYITINTDLALYSEEQAKTHWRTTGINEGRQASQGFAVLDYKRIYSDIAPMSNSDAIDHYVNTGYTEKRVGIWSWWCGNGANGGCDPIVTCTNSWAGWKPTCGMCPADYTGTGTRCYPSWIFAFKLWDATFYKNAHADVASLGYDQLREHWYTIGMSEGRQAIASFSVQDYKRIYSDVAAMSNSDAMRHWTTTGDTEKRVGIWAWWCGNGANGGCDAMVTCSNGWTGTPSCGACPGGYKGTGSTPGSCTLDTTSTSGIFSSKVYNYNFYITAHADLAGATQENAGLHWANSGISEGRQAVSSFIVGDYKRIYADAAAMTNKNAVLDYVTKYNRVGLWSRFCGNGANGGCDSLVTCTNSWGDMPPSCGMCPAGYTPAIGSTPGSCVVRPTTPPVVTSGGGSSSGTPTNPPPVTSGGGSSSGIPTTPPVTSGSSSTGTYSATGLLSSFVFKYEFYISANPDLASLSVDAAAQHWVSAGVSEGRQAHASFNVNEYKRIYPDAAGLSNSDAVLQYVSKWYERVGLWAWFCGNGNNGSCDLRVNCTNIWGARAPLCSMCPTGFQGTGDKPDGCYPRFVTDYRVWEQTYYTNKYQLTGLTYTTAGYHFYSVGVPAGHQAIATFSVSEYKQIYPDVAGMSNLDAIGHYVNTGFAEKRAGTFSNWCGYTPNGGCDPLTTCGINAWGEKKCGWCPFGYSGTGETGCVKY